jgi:ferredoxin
MIVRIDREGCIECGVCEATCPDIFELKDGEKAWIREGFRKNGNPAEGEIGAELESCAKSAVDGCPVSVISLE